MCLLPATRRAQFLSTLSLRRATGEKQANQSGHCISIHALLAESDNSKINICYGDLISIHALLAESDSVFCRSAAMSFYFYPRSPCGERRRSFPGRRCPANFYPRSPCGERQTSLVVIGTNCVISIHALLAESDTLRATTCHTISISIHALLAESDRSKTLSRQPRSRFLSTLSLRRATEYWVGGYGTANNFYPRSPCGERRPRLYPSRGQNRNFYPRSPCGERRVLWLAALRPFSISIHALLAESDSIIQSRLRSWKLVFLSTLSLRRATGHPSSV